MAQQTSLLANSQQHSSGVNVQRQIQLAMEQAQAVQSIGGSVASSVSSLTTSEAVESEILLNAAQQVVLQVGRPMHITDIKRVIVEKNLVSPGINTTLESVLIKDVHLPNGRFVVVDGQPGVFGVKGLPTGSRSKASKAKPRPKPPSVSSANNTVNLKAKAKYLKLKRYIKQMAFLNAAVCDEVIRVEEKVAKVREERRFLLKKLLQQQALIGVDLNAQPAAKQSVSTVISHTPNPFLTAGPVKVPPAPTRQSSTESSTADGEKAKPKKKAPSKKKKVPTATLR